MRTAGSAESFDLNGLSVSSYGAIRADPVMAGSAPEYFQAQFPTREAAEANIRERINRDIASRDTSDFIYQFDASRTYNLLPGLDKITHHTEG